MSISNISGTEGRVEVTGLRAVVAIFLRWSLERHGVSQSGEPTWILRAALSYQKDSLLGNKKLNKKIYIKYRPTKMFEVIPEAGTEITVEGTSLVVKGVTLCPVESQP